MSFITPEDLRQFLVLSVRNETQDLVLDAICKATHAMQLAYTDRDVLVLSPETGSSGVGSLNTLTDSSKAWTASAFVGQVLIDSAGDCFMVTASGATTLTVSGTPASGAYSVYPLQTERHDPRHIHGEMLRLRSWPVQGVVSAYSDDDTTDTVIQDDDFHLYAAEGKLHMFGGWKGPYYYWTIKYVGGYLNTDKEWPVLRHWQLVLGDAMWNDSGYKRFIVDQFGQAKGTLNFTMPNGNIYDSINRAMGYPFKRISL